MVRTGRCVHSWRLFYPVGSNTYSNVRKSIPADLFFRRIENLQYWKGRVDIKCGFTWQEQQCWSWMSWFYSSPPDPLRRDGISWIYFVGCILTYFIVDTSYMRRFILHLWSVCREDRLKLAGCLVFSRLFIPYLCGLLRIYPFPATPVWLLIIYVFVFLSGWVLSRGANLQKFYFKKYPGKDSSR